MFIGSFIALFVHTSNKSLNHHQPHLYRQKKPMTSTTAAVAKQATRMFGKISPETTALMLCDVQDRFRSRIHNSETVISNTRLLTSASKILDIPIVVTEQYPKAFGHTVKECFQEDTDMSTLNIFPKTLFSMITPEVSEHINTLNVSSFLITGVETHVCVQQTALDLLELGHDVHIIVDACSSQKKIDREVALQRLSSAGAYLTTAQSALFMLMKDAKHPNFKQISKLVVEHMGLPDSFNDELAKLS